MKLKAVCIGAASLDNALQHLRHMGDVLPINNLNKIIQLTDI